MPFVESTLQLADAVVTAINEESWDTEFTAVRSYDPRSKLGSGVCHVVITPKTPELSENDKRLTLTLTVWKRVGAEPTNEAVDPLWNLFFRIRNYLAGAEITINGEPVTWEPPGDSEHPRSLLSNELVFAMSDDMSWVQQLTLEDNTADDDE